MKIQSKNLVILICLIFTSCQKNKLINPFFGTYCLECNGRVIATIGIDSFGDPINYWVDTIYQMEINIMESNDLEGISVSNNLNESSSFYSCRSQIEEEFCTYYQLPSASQRVRREIEFRNDSIFTDFFSVFGTDVRCIGSKKN